MNNSYSGILIAVALLIAMVPPAIAQKSNPYESFKVPPPEISSKTKYTQRLHICGEMSCRIWKAKGA